MKGEKEKKINYTLTPSRPPSRPLNEDLGQESAGYFRLQNENFLEKHPSSNNFECRQSGETEFWKAYVLTSSRTMWWASLPGLAITISVERKGAQLHFTFGTD